MVDISVQPQRCAARVSMRVGASVPVAMTSVDTEVYTEGTTVFADGRALDLVLPVRAVRPHPFGTRDVRTWSPPV